MKVDHICLVTQHVLKKRWSNIDLRRYRQWVCYLAVTPVGISAGIHSSDSGSPDFFHRKTKNHFLCVGWKRSLGINFSIADYRWIIIDALRSAVWLLVVKLNLESLFICWIVSPIEIGIIESADLVYGSRVIAHLEIRRCIRNSIENAWNFYLSLCRSSRFNIDKIAPYMIYTGASVYERYGQIVIAWIQFCGIEITHTKAVGSGWRKFTAWNAGLFCCRTSRIADYISTGRIGQWNISLKGRRNVSHIPAVKKKLEIYVACTGKSDRWKLEIDSRRIFCHVRNSNSVQSGRSECWIIGNRNIISHAGKKCKNPAVWLKGKIEIAGTIRRYPSRTEFTAIGRFSVDVEFHVLIIHFPLLWQNGSYTIFCVSYSWIIVFNTCTETSGLFSWTTAQWNCRVCRMLATGES